MGELRNFYCENCGELWPTNTAICQQCRKFPNKYTVQNKMKSNLDDLPLHIKTLFEQLTMIEEMLISPILTIMSIFRLPGGQLLSRGYVANFTQDTSQLIKSLPRRTCHLPILIIKKTDQNNESKEFTVNRIRVQTIIEYLCLNNQDWIDRGISLDSESLESLPVNGIPNDLNEIIDSDKAFNT